MTLRATVQGRSTRLKVVLVGAASLGVLAVANYLAARLAERRHPPTGAFITVDGVRLHYTDQGEGSPVVLIHGNVVSGDDWNTSGVADLLRRNHRVIIFDRPGFGYSERPRGRLWTAPRQAELLWKALRRLGVERPVVVSHSWGTIASLAMAQRHQAEITGLVLVSGYYFPTLRPDALLVLPGAIPLLGSLLSHTISPLLGRLQMPLLQKAMFAPAAVSPRFLADYSPAMALRPEQIRASATDGALMIPGAFALRGSYRRLVLPVVIIAGEGDRVVFKRRAEQLRDRIPGAVLQVVEGAGHMVHHVAAPLIAQAVERVGAAANAPGAQGDRGQADPAGRREPASA